MGGGEQGLNIHHVVPDIHRLDAGPSYSVVRLAEELRRHHQVHLHALEPAPRVRPDVETTFYHRLGLLRSLGISPAMRRGLSAAAQHADIMHFHGMWMMPDVYPARAVRGTDCALVMSPRGMLDPWALGWSSRRKVAFGRLLQNRALDAVDCFHATSMQEERAIREAGYTAPVAVIPIGIDVPPLIRSASTGNQRTVLYLGRLHPKKNVDGLLRAWSSLGDRHPDWRLVIAGPGGDDYVGHLRDLAAGLPRVELRGPAYGNHKADLLSEADLFVLPTHSENFGIVVAEALSYGTPVISSTGAPWEGLEIHECGWWRDPSDDSLADALNEALSADNTSLREMGRAGRTWMEREFSWTSVADRTIAIYRWLSRGDAKPDFVVTT